MAVKFSEFSIGAIGANLELVGYDSNTLSNVQVGYSELKIDILAGAVTGSGASGQVSYWSGATSQAGSNNLFWDSANNNLGIGTNAPIGKLDIVSDGGGQMFFTRYGGQPQINIRRSQGTFAAPVAVTSGASSLFNFQNYNGTAFASSAQIQVVPVTQTLTDAGATMALNVVRAGTTTMTNGLLVSGTNATPGSISITTGFNGPNTRLTIWGSTIVPTLDYFDIVNSGGGQLLRFFNTANLVVGGGADSGQRLQVIGDTFLKGSGATSATSALLVQNSSAINLLNIRNDGRITNGDGSFYVDRYPPGGTVMVISTVAHNEATGMSITSATAIRAFSNLGINSSNPLGASIYAAGGTASGNISLGLLSNRALITSSDGQNMHSSSMLQVDSTTQGFLPPRMTTTQKNAIGTPARGLVVFDTTLVKLCVYNGTTWETITSV